MPDTPILGIPEAEESTSLPWDVVNLMVRLLEAGAGYFPVIDRTIATPPGSPADGDRYIVAASPTGAWTGWADRIVIYVAGTWYDFIPYHGLKAYDQAAEESLLFNSASDWVVDTGVAAADLDDLGDVDTTGVSDGDVLTFDSGSGDWVPAAPTGGYSGGVQSIPILAAAMKPRTTSGAATGSTETATNKIMLETLDFDQSTDEFAQFMFPMPKSWNESTVTAQFIWTAGSTGNVVWGIQAVAISDDDVLDAAFGTAQTVTDGVTAANDLMQSAFTSAMTIAGTPAEGDLVCFQVYRDADNGSDTVAADAKLIGIRLNLTTNAADDS